MGPRVVRSPGRQSRRPGGGVPVFERERGAQRSGKSCLGQAKARPAPARDPRAGCHERRRGPQALSAVKFFSRMGHDEGADRALSALLDLCSAVRGGALGEARRLAGPSSPARQWHPALVARGTADAGRATHRTVGRLLTAGPVGGSTRRCCRPRRLPLSKHKPSTWPQTTWALVCQRAHASGCEQLPPQWCLREATAASPVRSRSSGSWRGLQRWTTLLGLRVDARQTQAATTSRRRPWQQQTPQERARRLEGEPNCAAQPAQQARGRAMGPGTAQGRARPTRSCACSST